MINRISLILTIDASAVQPNEVTVATARGQTLSGELDEPGAAWWFARIRYTTGRA
jgi:hypothetical protein